MGGFGKGTCGHILSYQPYVGGPWPFPSSMWLLFPLTTEHLRRLCTSQSCQLRMQMGAEVWFAL